jgi:hypothetical protein
MMAAQIQTAVPRVETVAWMQLLDASNTNKKYYKIGNVTSFDGVNFSYQTFLVTEKGGNGGGQFYCSKHKFVYSINHGVCEECQKQVVTTDSEPL